MNTNDTPTDSSELSAEVTATGSAPRGNSYEIAPEHQHHADAILAMDPINDVPAPYEFPEGHRWPALKLTALPEAQRREVQGKLDALPPAQRAGKEAEFTAAAVRSMRAAIRVKTGVGPDATPFHRTMVGIAREVGELTDQFDRLQQHLSEVARYELETDPVTGERKPVPVYRVTGTRQKAYAEQQEDILRRIRLLVNDEGYGIEARQRLDQALCQSVAQRVERDRQLSERAEAKSRAEVNLREERINKQAASLASMQRNDF